MFIKVTKVYFGTEEKVSYRTSYINPEYITQITKDKFDGYIISDVNMSDSSFYVKETPEEILNLIDQPNRDFMAKFGI